VEQAESILVPASWRARTTAEKRPGRTSSVTGSRSSARTPAYRLPNTEYRLQIPHPPPGICGAIVRDVRISCGIDLVTCPGVSRLEEASWL
jgi:hypothetical protein